MTDMPEPKRRRWVTPLLIASLAFNLMIVGLVVGRSLSPDGPHRSGFDPGPSRGLVGEPFVRALPSEERRALVRDILENRSQIRENRDSLRKRFEAFLEALRADPYEPETVGKLLLEQRNVAIGRQEIGEDLLLRRIEAMSDDERSAYADRLEDSLRRFTRHRD